MRKKKNIAHTCLYFSPAERIPFTEPLFSAKNKHFLLSSSLPPSLNFIFCQQDIVVPETQGSCFMKKEVLNVNVFLAKSSDYITETI